MFTSGKPETQSVQNRTLSTSAVLYHGHKDRKLNRRKQRKVVSRSKKALNDFDLNILNCLLISWNQLFSLVEKCEAKYPSILITLIAPITLLGTYSQTTNKEIPTSLVLIVMIITLLAFSYMAVLYRYSAMLRGELSRIEEKIDDLLHEGIFLWNRCQVNSRLTRGNTFLMMNYTLILSVLGLIGCGFAILDDSNPNWIKHLPIWNAGNLQYIYNLFSSTCRSYFVSIYLIFLLIDIVGIFISFFNNTKHLKKTFAYPFDLALLKEGEWLNMAQSAVCSRSLTTDNNR